MKSEDQNRSSAVEEVLNVGESFVLPVGTQLQIEIDGVAARMQSVSVGWLPDNYLVIRQPSTGFGSIAHKLFKGNKVTVRYLSGGAVFAFQSQVIAATDSPRVIFLTYPTVVVRRSLRAAQRFLCYLQANLLIEHDNPDFAADEYRVIITDISLMGCAVEMTTELNPKVKILPYIKMDETIKIRTQLPGVEKVIELQGEVRRTQRDERELNIGVRFDKSIAHAKDDVAEYIRSIEKSNV
jgi:hypothetical protein